MSANSSHAPAPAGCSRPPAIRPVSSRTSPPKSCDTPVAAIGSIRSKTRLPATFEMTVHSDAPRISRSLYCQISRPPVTFMAAMPESAISAPMSLRGVGRSSGKMNEEKQT